MRQTLLMATMVVAALLACKQKNSTSSGTSPEKGTPTARKGPDLTMDVGSLLSEYKANEVRADTQYKGKRIRITGKVGDIKKDIMNSIYVTVGTGAQFEIPTAQCFFDDKYTQKAASLSKGESLTVDCNCTGLMMNVLMKECTFVE